MGCGDFFLYKDLGIETPTGGKVLAQLVKANKAPEKALGGTVMRHFFTS